MIVIVAHPEMVATVVLNVAAVARVHVKVDVKADVQVDVKDTAIPATVAAGAKAIVMGTVEIVVKMAVATNAQKVVMQLAEKAVMDVVTDAARVVLAAERIVAELV